MRRHFSIILALCLIVSLASPSSVLTDFSVHASPTVAYAASSNTVKVDRVVDGDTFVCYISGEKTRVRLIGVDTPESVHPDATKNTKWGRKVSKWAKKKLTGKTVTLKYDKDRYDQYGRTLAYVYLGKTMFNKTLLKKGYARAVYYSPNGKYRKVFNKLQAKAKKQKKGFWKDGYKAAFPG